MNILTIDRMPTRVELESIDMGWLVSYMGRYGGMLHWASVLKLDTKKKYSNIKEKDIPVLIKDSMNKLNTNRMPSRSELLEIYENNSLHNKIVRTGGYRFWANKLGLELKESETQLGQDFEEVAIKILEKEGYSVESMSTKCPFDLLVGGYVRVDVKTSRPHRDKNNCRLHTFGINKKQPSCDIYMILALDEEDNIERTMIIPSHKLKVMTLCIGTNSKYNKYIKKFDYITEYLKFYKSIK